MNTKQQVLIPFEEDTKIVRVHSGAIHIENKAKLVQRKAWFELVYRALPLMSSQNIFSISIKDLKAAIGWDESKNDEKLKELLHQLTSTSIQWNILEKDNTEVWESNALLSGCRIVKGSGICSYSFSPFLQKKLLNPEMYAKIDLIVSHKFKSKYSLAIYCLALDYLNIKFNYGEKNLTIEEIRKYLGLKDNEYKLIGDLNRRVIKPSEEEINEISDMIISITPITKGKKTTGFKFTMRLQEKRLFLYQSKRDQDNNQKVNVAPTETIKNKDVIIIKSEKVNKFFAKHNISYTNDTFQSKLKELQELLGINKIEGYLEYLSQYTEVEHKKGNIKNFAGFFVSLFKDNIQIDNYLTYQAEIKQKEQEKNSVLDKYLKLELETKYESFLSADFQEYVFSNIDKLSTQITKLVEDHINKGSFVYDTVIKVKMEGVFSIEKYKTLNKAQQVMFFPDFRKHKAYFNYQPLSFSEWKNKHITKEELSIIKEDLKKKIF